jgi:hypothetical protein
MGILWSFVLRRFVLGRAGGEKVGCWFPCFPSLGVGCRRFPGGESNSESNFGVAGGRVKGLVFLGLSGCWLALSRWTPKPARKPNRTVRRKLVAENRLRACALTGARKLARKLRAKVGGGGGGRSWAVAKAAAGGGQKLVATVASSRGCFSWWQLLATNGRGCTCRRFAISF